MAPGSRGALGQRALWFMRLSILAMIAVALAVLYQRHHLSPEQEELIRFVEVQVPSLQRVHGPLSERLAGLLADRHRPAEQVRAALVDEIIPGFVRLRQLGEGPVAASRTEVVRALSREFQEVVDAYQGACRAAVVAIDEPKLDPKEALLRVQRPLFAAIERERLWGEHVRDAAVRLNISPRAAGTKR